MSLIEKQTTNGGEDLVSDKSHISSLPIYLLIEIAVEKKG